MSARFKTFRLQLRAETDKPHKSLEAILTATGLTGHRDDYATLLESLLRIYRPLEVALAKLDWTPLGLNVVERSKMQWLAADLAALGRDPHMVKDWPTIPLLDTTFRGLGALYVVEGASLGGQVISRWLREHLGIGPSTGGRFFSSYGDDVSRMWRSYLEVLEAAAADAPDAELVTSAALETFQAFQECMTFTVAQNRTAVQGLGAVAE